MASRRQVRGPSGSYRVLAGRVHPGADDHRQGGGGALGGGGGVVQRPGPQQVAQLAGLGGQAGDPVAGQVGRDQRDPDTGNIGIWCAGQDRRGAAHSHQRQLLPPPQGPARRGEQGGQPVRQRRHHQQRGQ
ncbi:hypothetical protein [Acrocarpospora corrugata]|uniref:hypothetical protein n=1 Tax=Acrocarpospora corrugata TaxID=35763 RepID=UPI0014794D10|nr:hypothetical protein [Acrocarpospora corrugata]